MRSRALFFLHFFLVAVVGYAQENKYIVFRASVIDTNTKEPVLANIKYESLPFGSKIGVLTGQDFVFNMEDGNDYLVIVRADGYSPHVSTEKIGENIDGRIEKVIELTPNNINRLIRLQKLVFSLGESNISSESYTELNQIADMLKKSPAITIQLEGHTDFSGNMKENMKLSRQRVMAVRDYLVKQGIQKKRIRTKAFGGTQPLTRSTDIEQRVANRRVEVRILEN